MQVLDTTEAVKDMITVEESKNDDTIDEYIRKEIRRNLFWALCHYVLLKLSPIPYRVKLILYGILFLIEETYFGHYVMLPGIAEVFS
ncbi:hypothetical protein ACF0H5_012217 [Mactra antiquata]